MLFLYILLATYICAVNFCAFCLIKRQYNEWEADEKALGKGDGKLMLIALLGGSLTLYVTMFVLKYRLSNILFMISLPVLAVLNIYCFFLGFRGIAFLI